MALIKCRECKKEVSGNAKTCPHCGISSPKGRQVGTLTGLIIIGGAAYLITKMLGGLPDQPPSAQQTAAQKQRIEEMSAISAAKRLVKERLKDPDSAQFSTVVYRPKTKTVCGYVNAKNSFGGYTGNRGFISNGAQSNTSIQGDSAGFAEAWNDICALR